MIPVSAVPLEIELGAYELGDDGEVVESGRATETVHVPLAHTEGGLTASMTRGALAAGTIRTYVLHDRITRASCFVCGDAADAIALARWVEAELPAMQEWLASSDDASLSKRARLRGVKTHVVGPMCHVLWQWTTGDAVGPNMMTRNSYALNMAYVMQHAPVKPERAVLEANMGGDKKPSAEFFQSGHGKTVLAEAFLTDEQIRRVLRTTAADLEALSWAARTARSRAACSRSRSRPRRRSPRSSRRPVRISAWSERARWRTAPARRVEGGLQASIRFGGLEVGTVGGGTTLPSARDWLASIGCAGSGTVYRFAQIIAAAALALEISASAAMATAGSENFFQAHHERGGLR